MEASSDAATETGHEHSSLTSTPRAISWKLYTSHFLSTWNSRSFEFCSVLFLAAIYPNTLLYLSIYAMIRSASAIVLAAPIGRAVDSRDRLAVVRFSIVFGRVSVVLSCLGFWGLWDHHHLSSRLKLAIFVGLILLSCIEKMASIINVVAIERDWVVVIAENNESALQKLNAHMRRIDLICKLMGPLLIALINGASTTVALWLTVALNAFSLSIEYFAIARVYGVFSALQEPKTRQSEGLEQLPPTRLKKQFLYHVKTWTSALHYYFTHSACLPSFSLSLLYLTVLSFSGQMTTYLLSAGIKSSYVGLLRGMSVIFELSATWVGPRVMSKIGPYRAGMWFLSWQTIWLAATVTFFWNEPVAVIAASGLSAGTILSRTGLWGYDLSAQVIVQQEVQDTNRGSFSSTEALFQNVFELISYALTIALPRPDQFQYPVLISGIAVFVAGGLYAMFLRGRRGHLVHVPCAGKV